MNSYQENFVVKWHEIDCNLTLRPFSFMSMAQECANVHSAVLKFGYKELIALDEVWILSRIKIIYTNPPKWGDKVSMETWHKGKHGLFWVRDFVLSNMTGETVALATSSWVIMNINTRRIERKTIFDVSKDIDVEGDTRAAIELPCDKILPNPDKSFVRSHTVMFSDIDFNMHANNAKYIEWIMDSIPLDFLKEHVVKELQVNYIAEAKMGDVIEISKGEKVCENGDIEIYLQGDRDGVMVFHGLVKFGKLV